MSRSNPAVPFVPFVPFALSVLSVLACGLPALRAQDPAAQFRTEFNQGLDLADNKIVDKAVKRSPEPALGYYADIYWDKEKGDEKARAKCLALQESWKRCFENSETMEKLERWMNGASTTMHENLRKRRATATKLWADWTDHVSKGTKKQEFEALLQAFMDLARAAEAEGHYNEIAEVWGLAAVIATKMPEKTIANRRDGVFITEQFLNARKNWGYTFDPHYIGSAEFVKFEKERIEEAAKAEEKRKGEGYDPGAKGIDALLMPNAVEAKHALKFDALANWDELDFGPKGGPVPAFWRMASTEKPGTSREMYWFKRAKLYLMRTGAAKFAVGRDDPMDKSPVEIDASPKAKVSTFWLDAEKKVPYAMAFWVGSEREMVNEAECNMAPGDAVANVYCRSVSSWTTQVGADAVVLYDDNCSGHPGDAGQPDPPARSHTLGEFDGDGTIVPSLDSMRIGKGPRVPYSEFVKLSTGWQYMKKAANDGIGLKPLNPDYVKTGKIKLVWAGAKPTVPVQLVVQGSGDFQTAYFEVGGGKEVEVPAAEYTVIWGRIVIGKGARAQVANIYQGSAKPFTVEAGKTFELKMGAPFTLQWTRRGDQTTRIEATKILLTESSGCLLTELHGINLACEAMFAKDVDGKGAKVGGKFVRFTDPELVNKAANQYRNLGLLTACFPMPDGYREGEMILEVKLPAEGMKVSLQIKKHPLFGDVKAPWQ